MFEKLLANLPYNPSLVKELGFYARRIRQEESLRRMGFVFIFLAFMVQFYAFISPPQPSVAASTNDMINGGFSSIGELTADCKANIKEYRTIIGYYGISCADLAKGVSVSLVSTSYSKHLFSMGWNPQGPVNVVTHKPTDEQPANIPGVSSPLYWRYLWSWDPGKETTYQAVKVISSGTGQVFYILYACGNIVHVGIPKTPTKVPPPPPPKPCPYDRSIAADSEECKPCSQSLSSTDTVACIEYSKTARDITQDWSDANGMTARPGDKIIYTLTAFNSGKATVKAFIMQDDLSYVLDYANLSSSGGGKLNQNDIISWPKANISPQAALVHKIVVIVKNPIPSTQPSASDPELFDHIMTNIYGNTININLPQSPVSVVASASTTLPNTGPGSSLVIAAIIVAVAGYFLARARLLTSETTIAIRDNNGGMIQ